MNCPTCRRFTASTTTKVSTSSASVLDQDKDKLTSFLKEKQMPWPQYFDGKGWGNTLAGTYGVNSIPATYLVGKDGKIIGKDLRGDALENAVKTALAANN